MNNLAVNRFNPGRTRGPSPAADRFYVLILFDISEPKKYRTLVKILKRYGFRIQKSVFEAELTHRQIAELVTSLEKLMRSERFYDVNDSIRVYRISGNCEAIAFGNYTSTVLPENMVL